MKKQMTFLAGLGALLAGWGCGGAECPPQQPCPACPPQIAAPAPVPTPPPQSSEPQGPMVEEWIQLPVRILFSSAGAQLSAENRAMLDQAVQTLRARDDVVRVRIEGHSDTRGPDAGNTQLSLQRAQAVMDYLVSRGVPQSMLEVAGYGAERPLVIEGGHDENRAQNRRVEFSALLRRPVSQQGQPF